MRVYDKVYDKVYDIEWVYYKVYSSIWECMTKCIRVFDKVCTSIHIERVIGAWVCMFKIIHRLFKYILSVQVFISYEYTTHTCTELWWMLVDVFLHTVVVYVKPARMCGWWIHSLLSQAEIKRRFDTKLFCSCKKNIEAR